jgi:2-amino-4-hydroxy-6-hydroxymethyldihydropteridine diphosphokinase
MNRPGQLIEVIVAVGSNLGDREAMLKRAGAFLESISVGPVTKSCIWETDPVGPSKYPFLNATARIVWGNGESDPADVSDPADALLALLHKLKSFELECGRPENPERWGPRVLDLDIIAAGSLSLETEQAVDDSHRKDGSKYESFASRYTLRVQKENLIIPHPEYSKRWFVLAPLQEIEPNWKDPIHQTSIQEMLDVAEPLTIKKTTLIW